MIKMGGFAEIVRSVAEPLMEAGDIKYHGTNHKGGFTIDPGGTLFLAHTKSLARDYAGGGQVVRVRDLSRHPLVLRTPEQFIQAWQESGADQVRGRFHPDKTGAFAAWARSKGYDAIVIPKSAFVGELGYEYVAGTVGEPQTIILDPRNVEVVESLTEGSAAHPDVVIMVDEEYEPGSRFRVYERGADRASVHGWDGVRRWLDVHSHDDAWLLFQRTKRPYGHLILQNADFLGDRLRLLGGGVHPEARELLI